MGVLRSSRSAWSLARRGAVRSYLEGVDALAGAAWRHAGIEGAMPELPEVEPEDAFIAGWDDADEE